MVRRVPRIAGLLGAVVVVAVGASSSVTAASVTPRAALPCHAVVSTAHPTQYSDVNVGVTTVARAHVVTVAHYRTTDHQKATTANVHGRATITYYISDATRGYRVVVSVTVTKGASVGHCATAFTPR